MAAISLFWDTNMAAKTSCENTQSFYQIHPRKRLTRAVRVSRAGLEPNAPHKGKKRVPDRRETMREWRPYPFSAHKRRTYSRCGKKLWSFDQGNPLKCNDSRIFYESPFSLSRVIGTINKERNKENLFKIKTTRQINQCNWSAGVV